MRQILSITLLPLLLISLNSHALLIKDIFVVEQQLIDDGIGHVFEMTSAGYNPETDSITNIKLIYDFTEIYSETNLGDEDEVPVDAPIDWPPYPDEMVTFSSWIFYWRDFRGDVDSGLTVFEADWTRNDMCQFEVAPEDEPAYCWLNIDLYGNMNAAVIPHTNNLWLHSITAEIEVDRIAVPEPNSAFLLGIGLLAMGFLRRFKMRHVK